MMKMTKCNKPYCDNPAVEPCGNGKWLKLCAKHAAERKARQLYTASLPDCTRCNNKARKDDFLCGACREQENAACEAAQQQAQHEEDHYHLRDLERRLAFLEDKVTKMEALLK